MKQNQAFKDFVQQVHVDNIAYLELFKSSKYPTSVSNGFNHYIIGEDTKHLFEDLVTIEELALFERVRQYTLSIPENIVAEYHLEDVSREDMDKLSDLLMGDTEISTFN